MLDGVVSTVGAVVDPALEDDVEVWSAKVNVDVVSDFLRF